MSVPAVDLVKPEETHPEASTSARIPDSTASSELQNSSIRHRTVEKDSQAVLQEEMLRSGPRDLPTELGQETDATELMETGRALEKPTRSNIRQNDDSQNKHKGKLSKGGSALSPQDQRAMILLVSLCMLHAPNRVYSMPVLTGLQTYCKAFPLVWHSDPYLTSYGPSCHIRRLASLV